MKVTFRKCWKCNKLADTILVTYPEGDKYTCKKCFKKYQKTMKKAFGE